MLPWEAAQSILQTLEHNIKEMSKKKNGVRPVSASKIGSSLTFILIPENSDPPKDILVFF